jgi:hypothetical protein
VCELSDGETKFLCAMKLVSIKDLGVWGAQSDRVLKTPNANSLLLHNVKRCLKCMWRQLKKTRKPYQSSPKQTNYAHYKHLKTCYDFLTCKMNEPINIHEFNTI